MVVTIERSVSSCSPSLAYNERKVEKGVAAIVGYSNVDSLDRRDLEDLFSRYERGRISASGVSFHASVNPSDTDACTEEQVLDLIWQMMSALGYSDQPMVVYRHDDIGRPHYHVVSTRIASDGHRIDAWHERMRAQEVMRRLGPDLGFEVGRGAVSKASVLDDSGAGMSAPSRFDPVRDMAPQVSAILAHCLSYNFTSASQFRLAMEHHGVSVSEYLTAAGPRTAFRGLDSTGRPVTRSVTEEELGIDVSSQLAAAVESGRRTHRVRTRERIRVENLVSSCFAYSRSEQHLSNMLLKQGVSMHVSVSEDGRPFGITFIDHHTRTAFKASELHGVISIAMMKEAVESGRWRETDRGQQKESHVKRSRSVTAALRSAMASCARNMSAGGGGSAGSAGEDRSQDRGPHNTEVYDANVTDRNVYDRNITSL